MAQILAALPWQPTSWATRWASSTAAVGKDVRNAELGDRDQAEALGRERDRPDISLTRAVTLCPRPTLFCDHELPRLRVADIRNRRVAPRLLIGTAQDEAVAVFFDHAEQLFATACELLHHMCDMAVSARFRARQHPVAYAKRAIAAALDDAEFRRWNALRFPMFRDADRLVVVDFRHDLQDASPWEGHPFYERRGRGPYRSAPRRSCPSAAP